MKTIPTPINMICCTTRAHDGKNCERIEFLKFSLKSNGKPGWDDTALRDDDETTEQIYFKFPMIIQIHFTIEFSI